jgi:hypothetical protein
LSRPRTTLLARLLVPCALVGSGLLAAPAHATTGHGAPDRTHAFDRQRGLGVAKPATSGSSVIDVVVPLHQQASQRAAMQRLARSSAPRSTRAAQVRSLAPGAGPARAVRLWAGANGFEVTSTTPWSVGLRGRAADLAAAFGTSLSTAQVSGKGFVRPRTAPRVPSALAGVADAVVGLDTRPLFRGRAAYGGGDVQVLNRVPVRGSTAGTGATVATVNLSGWHPGDLTTYRKAAFGGTGANPGITNVVVGGGHAAATVLEDDFGDQTEVALDAETIAGVAPGAKQRMYFGGNSGADYVAILQKMATDLADLSTANDFQTASTSWGACELDVPETDLLAMSDAITAITAAGATFFAASGDSGAYGCNYLDFSYGAAVDFPASAPDAVAVGGTTVTGDASGYTSTTWGGSGGGCSAYFPAPARQVGVSACAGRSVPDIATLADPDTGFWVFDKVDLWMPVGGTSLAAPASAAGLADVMSHAALSSLSTPFLTTAYQQPGAFTDVTTGTNGLYRATAGYDLATGLGSPLWTQLEGAITGGAAPTPTGFNVPLVADAPSQTNPVPLSVDLGTGSPAPSIVPNGEVVTGYAVSASAPFANCTSTAPGLPTQVTLPSSANGLYPLHLALTTSGPGGCVLAQRSVRLDNIAPVVATPVATYVGTTSPAYRFSWPAATESGAGVIVYGAWVTDLSTGADVASFYTVGRTFPYPSGAPFKAVPGHLYEIEVGALDGAFNSGYRSRVFAAPHDDTAATLSKHLSNGSYVSDWSRAKGSADYRLSHVLSGRKGASFAVKVTGKSLALGVLKSPYGGYADIYVDGVKRSRVSLYSSTVRYRQPLSVFSVTTRQTHTVKVVVVGAHASASKGNLVYLDSITVGP